MSLADWLLAAVGVWALFHIADALEQIADKLGDLNETLGED